MATAIDIITRALRLINAIEAGEVAQAEDAVDGLAALNEMVNGWENAGIHIGWSNVGQSDELLVHDKYLEGIRYNLAVRLAAEYDGIDAPRVVVNIAVAAYKMFQLNTFEYDADMETDRALHPRYFTRRVGAYDIDEG
jgi:hypothetical protein